MVEYRKLCIDDLSAVLQMNLSFRAGFIDSTAAKAFLSKESNWLFAAIEEGDIIGFAYGYELNRLDRSEPMLYIHEVGVKESHQRIGIGYRLMQELLSECRAKGICKCFLTTYQNNAAANALYKKLGGSVPEESQGNDTVYWFKTS